MSLLDPRRNLACAGALAAAVAACTSADTATAPTSPTTGGGDSTSSTQASSGSGGGASASSSVTTSSTTTATGSSSASGGGTECVAPKPTTFPYEPACCGYQVAIPDAKESGFDDGKGSDKPDHVHVGLAGPSDTTFAVNWRTGNDTTASQLLLGTDKAAVEAATAATSTVQLVAGHHLLYGSTLDGTSLTRVHEAHACGLKPGTQYFYKVGGPGAWSVVHSVTTGPVVGSSEAMRFAVLGDSRNDPSVFAKIEEALAAKAPDLQIFTGDAVATGAVQTQWNSWFESTSGSFKVETTLASAPFMPVNGNHESLAVNYPAQFVMPQHVAPGEKAQGEEYYSFEYGNAHFIALNDTPESGALAGTAQFEWLKADLAAVDRKKTPWLFVMHHRSTYSCGNHGSDLDLRKAWQPLFDQYQVDVVFSGHDHMYERSKPIRGLSGSTGKLAQSGPKGTPVKGSGTLYLVTGGAGAPLYNVGNDCDHTYVTEKTRNYVVVDLAGTKIQVKAYRLDGSLIDDFEFVK
ncbi:MAG: metallophosphoesterase family protein [Deltaproteobacteria bacterium]|nr:metallophosphoesterase family protein [Deltaproteobacteria bacterium]